MSRWLSAATASSLLLAAALIVVFPRPPDRGVELFAPPVVERPANPVNPAPAKAKPARGAPSQTPRQSEEARSTQAQPEKKPRAKAPRATFTPFTPSSAEIVLAAENDVNAPSGLYDDRAEDALLAGAPIGPLTLPTEVTDPPEGLGEPLPPPVVANGLEVDEIGPFSAVVRFTTDQDVAGVVGVGWDVPVSFVSDVVGRDHEIALSGLVPDTQYVVQVASHTGEDKPELAFVTNERPLSPDASTADGRIELDDEPFFPVTAYGACASQFNNLLLAGVNVFGWDYSCGDTWDDLRDSIDSLADRAYWTVPWADRALEADGMIGYTQPDEPDGLGVSASTLPNIRVPGKVTFLTLTQHFAPGTGDLPWQHPGYYEAFVPKADVFGVDFYPLQSLCSPEKLALNHDVQVELLRLTGGKPTLQWIETAVMKCPERMDAAITDDTIRAEMFLAIAGGANGLGVFPSRIGLFEALAFRATLDTIEQAWPMLMTPRLPVEIGGDGASVVRASARTAGGATMLVVSNSSLTSRAVVELRVPGASSDQVYVSIDDALEVSPTEGVLRLDLDPLESHILVAAPTGYSEPEAAEDE